MRKLSKAKLTLGCLLLLATLAFAVTPDRSKGISTHMLPKSVADLSGAKWGLTVTGSPSLTPDAGTTTLQTSQEFLAFVQKQSDSARENGVWIVTTNPAAYSEPEKAFLNEVINVCKQEKIPLFLVRGSQLPNGWQRVD